MADQSERDRLDNVAPGDIITLRPSDEPGAAAGQYKVVHKDLNETSTTIVVTLETDDGGDPRPRVAGRHGREPVTGIKVGIGAESHPPTPRFVTSGPPAAWQLL